MELSTEQRDQLTQATGCYIKSACDVCHKLLGSVRYTRKDESGEWCSEICRDGIAVSTEREIRRARKGGRPVKHQSDRARKLANAQYQKDFRKRKKNPLVSIENTRLAAAI